MSKLDYQNIFEAITDKPGEAADLEFRADMMLLLRSYFESKEWSQAQIAETLGVAQPRVSELMHGKINTLSSDKLICYLSMIGFKIKPSFQAAPKSSKRPPIRCDVLAREAA